MSCRSNAGARAAETSAHFLSFASLRCFGIPKCLTKVDRVKAEEVDAKESLRHFKIKLMTLEDLNGHIQRSLQQLGTSRGRRRV